MESYDNVIKSPTFQSDLRDLNQSLIDSLKLFKANEYLNGNLFYTHRQRDFLSTDLNPDMVEKRRRFFDIARQGETLLEIGVNGGHSLLLAKSANPELKCFGIDLCKQVEPSWARVDVYTPVAMRWLQERFPGDFHFITGNSLVEAPKFCLDNPEQKIDILHVDGDKETYLRDIVNLLPALSSKSLIVVDDTNLRVVRRALRKLTNSGLVRLHPDFSYRGTQRYQSAVLQPV